MNTFVRFNQNNLNFKKWGLIKKHKESLKER